MPLKVTRTWSPAAIVALLNSPHWIVPLTGLPQLPTVGLPLVVVDHLAADIAREARPGRER